MENEILYDAGCKRAICHRAKLVYRMYNVILCDDDPLFLNQLNTMVVTIAQHSNILVKIYKFTALEDISNHILKTCDIAILDIDFSGKSYSGLDIAKRLRIFRKDSVIIFATNYIEYAPEGYEVHAFRYILKSEVTQKLERYMSQAFHHLHAESETIKFQINGEIIDIPLDRILYIESQLHTVKVFVQVQDLKKVREYTFYSSIGKLEQYLSPKGFLRIHKSFLVNMKHIRRYQCQKVELANGIELRASTNRYAEQKEQYLLWKGQIING